MSFPSASTSYPTPILDRIEQIPTSEYTFSVKRLLKTIALAIIIILFFAGTMILVFESDLLMRVVAACSRYYPRIASMLGVLAPGLGVAKIDPLQFVAAFLSTLFFVILIHELGHLIAGRCVGMKFLGLRVGPILLSNEFGKLKTSFHATGSFDGFALVKFESITRISHSLRIMVLGGPAATAAGAAAAWLLLTSGFLQGFFFGWAQLFIYFSLCVLIQNLFPFQTMSGMFSDGARLKMLTFPSENTYRWLAEIALGLQARSGRRLRLLNQRWLSLATKLSDGSRDELAGTFYAYLAANDAKNESLAAFHLERCLHIAGKRTSPFTDLLYLEASVFQAWFRRNPEKASAWRKLARGVHKLPWFILLRADTALLWSQGNVDQALSNCDEALTKVDTLPAEQREPFTRGWMEWKDEIVQRSQELQAVSATTV